MSRLHKQIMGSKRFQRPTGKRTVIVSSHIGGGTRVNKIKMPSVRAKAKYKKMIAQGYDVDAEIFYKELEENRKEIANIRKVDIKSIRRRQNGK